MVSLLRRPRLLSMTVINSAKYAKGELEQGLQYLQESARKLKSLDAGTVGMADQVVMAQWGGLQAISNMAASIDVQTLSKLCGSNPSAGAIFIAFDNLK